MRQVAAQLIALVPALLLHGVAAYVALAVFFLMSLNISASNTSSKTRALEQRMAAIEGITFPNTGGSLNGPLSANGNVSATGDMNPSGNANVGGIINQSSGATNEFSGGIHTAGSSQTDGNHTVGGIVNQTSGSTNEFSGGIHSSQNIQADGNIIASNYSSGQGIPSGYPIAHGTPWENQIIDFLNTIVANCHSAGVL